MSEIDVSDELYRQLEAEADEGEIEDTLWEILGAYRRTQNPQADVE